MAENVSPPILRRINIDNATPGILSSRAVQMAGIKNFPVPTDSIVTIGAECFGVKTEKQLSFTIDLPNDKPNISEQKPPYEIRYDSALAIGRALFPNEQRREAEYFARSLLLPESMVKRLLGNGLERPQFSLRKLAQLAINADVPMHALIEKLGDIRNHGFNPKDVTAGFPDKQTTINKGFICTNRGIKHDATQVIENMQNILNEKGASPTTLPNIFAVRTEYNGTQAAYSIKTFPSYGYIRFQRPTGEVETLLQFHLDKKFPIGVQSYRPNATFINIDSDSLNQN